MLTLYEFYAGMGRRKSKDTLEVAEGVYLKKNGTSVKWHYYFTLDGHKFRKTTKTKDLTKAKKVALDAYHDAMDRKRSGKITQKISFKTLRNKYVERLDGEKKAKFHRETLDRHFMGFFGKFDDITQIKQGDLQDYIVYRRKKSKVKNISINKENAAFNQMMAFAQDHEWLEKTLKFKKLKEDTNRRPHFTKEEYKRLLEVSRRRRDEFLASKHKGQSKGLVTKKYWNRALLHDIIIVLANTGMRVDEIKTVTWRDIDWERKTIKLWNAGKTASSRIVVVRWIYGMRALERIRERRLKYLKEKGQEFNDREHVQSLANGEKVSSMKKGFNELLKECHFKYASKEDKHTLTSLRHTYATNKLKPKYGERASTRALSKQMGTSERMIDKHYGHDTEEDYYDQLAD